MERLMEKEKLVVLDVREDIRKHAEPFQKIMSTVDGLAPDETLLLINLFEPLPLYEVMAKKGFTHAAEWSPREGWKIYFRRGHAAQQKEEKATTIRLDTRGLEPPQPMILALRFLPNLEEGTHLLLLTDRRPVLLYPKLDERGFSHETKVTEDGSFQTKIWK